MEWKKTDLSKLTDEQKAAMIKRADMEAERDKVGDWWKRVPDEDKWKYNRTWLYVLYADKKFTAEDFAPAQ